MIATLITKLILQYRGWKIKGNIPEGIQKAILVSAPHTSNMDFVIGRSALYQLGFKHLKFFIKKEAFFFPFGGLLKKLGGIPVDRKRNTLIKDTVKTFSQTEKLFLIITPEGTRKPVKRWKRGFYSIALEAGIPLILTYIDYQKKEGGIGPMIYPSGDWDKDLQKIKAFYADKTARFPENFVLPE